MHRVLGAAFAALLIAVSASATAQADPSHDFAGSHMPASVRQAPPDPRARAHAASFSGLIGPDVSSWQGCAINWGAVARVRSFAFVKASEGLAWNDPCFARNWQQMAAAGMMRGAYEFARPHAPIGSARAQARHFVGVVTAAGGFRHALPPVLDVETSGGLSPRALRAWIQTWVDEVRAETHRYRVTIYTGAWFWNPSVGAWAPRGALLWASGYSSSRPRVAGFAAPSWWQFTDGTYGPTPHSTPGLGAADHSVWLGTRARLRRLAHLRAGRSRG